MTKTPVGLIQTVLGPVNPENLGITMAHEHLLLDITCYVQQAEAASDRTYRNTLIKMDNLGNLPERFQYSLENMTLLDEAAAIEEAYKFKLAGGQSFVDTTSGGLIGRDPLGLARISRAIGINIVMGSGYYVWQSHPEDMNDKSVESIAEEIINEIENGVKDTGIKPGVIGEIGCSWPWTDNEKISMEASVMAHKETGLPLLIHPGRNQFAPLEIINYIENLGADLSNVVMGHVDRTIFDYDILKDTADTGVYINLDLWGHDS